MMQQLPKLFSKQHIKWIVKKEILSTFLNMYTQFVSEATIEVYLSGRISKSYQ